MLHPAGHHPCNDRQLRRRHRDFEQAAKLTGVDADLHNLLGQAYSSTALWQITHPPTDQTAASNKEDAQQKAQKAHHHLGRRSSSVPTMSRPTKGYIIMNTTWRSSNSTTTSIIMTLLQFGQFGGENRFTEPKATRLSTVWVDSHKMMPKVSFLRTDVVILGKL